MRHLLHTLVVPLAALLLATAAHAGQWQDLEQIRATARALVEADLGSATTRTEITVGHLDGRLRLQQCDQPLRARPLGQRRGLGSVTVSVICDGTKPWTVHLPVTVRAFAEVVVASRPLPRRVAIAASDVHLEERDIAALRSGYFERIEQVVGRMPRRTLVAGAPIAPIDLESDKIIRRGQKVTIVAKGAGIAVRMQGRALDDAARGEMVTVENLSSKRKIEALAVKPGVVEVPM